MMDNVYEIIIIGAGPSGMNAALYASRANMKTIMIEKECPGGKMTKTKVIDNYIGGSSTDALELASNMFAQSIKYGAKYKQANVVGIEDGKYKRIVLSSGEIIEGKSVILAMGGKLGKDNFKYDYYLNKGLSYCVVCDANFYKDKVVALIGDNKAIDDVDYLSNIAKKVYVLNRTDIFKAGEYKLNKMKQMKNVEILTNAAVKGINGNEVLESVYLVINKKKQNLKVDGLFVAIGHEPDLDFINFEIGLDKYGFIKVDDEQKTSVENVFACGDIVSKKFKQVITACADGARAGNSCIGE